MLAEITLAVGEGDRDDGESQVCRGPQSVAVADDLDGLHQAEPAHLGDVRVLPEAGEALAEELAHGLRAGDQVFSLHDLENFVGDGARGGVGAEGVEHQVLAAFGDGRHNFVRRVDAADWGVAAGKALSADHDVRGDAPVVYRELRAGTAEAAHDFVRDEKDAVLPADVDDARPVAGGRDDRPGCAAHDGLGDKGGDGVRAFTEDDLFESIRRLPSAVLRGAAEGALQAIVRADFWEVEEKGLVSFPTGRMAAYRESRERDAVIRGLPADDLPALGAARADVMQAGESQRRFD